MKQTNFPFRIIDGGLAIISDSGLERIFNEEKYSLSELLFEKKPRTKREVHKMAHALISCLEYPAFLPIKQYALNNEKDLGKILRAAAKLLRDFYLVVHPEVKY